MIGDLPEDRAGLYVLGVLDAEEMAAVRRDALRDARLAAEIATWERRLTPLTALAGQTDPPPALWESVQARIDGALAANAPPLPRRERAGGRGARTPRMWSFQAWRAVAIIAVVFNFAYLAYSLRQGSERLAMVLPLQQAQGGWLLKLEPNGRIHAVAQGNVTHGADRDFELWALAEHATRPVPLGLLPAATNSAELQPAGLPKAHFKLLVSLEPKGGSPTGAPTGPVMYAGTVIE